MKRLTLIILFTAYFLTALPAYAEKTFNLNDFCDRDWIVDVSAYKPETTPIKQGLNFAQNGEVTSFIYLSDGKTTGVINFYLSDSLVTEFDHSKVGKTSTGKYIVTLNKANCICNFEIMSLSSEQLILKNMNRMFIIKFTAE